MVQQFSVFFFFCGANVDFFFSNVVVVGLFSMLLLLLVNGVFSGWDNWYTNYLYINGFGSYVKR